MTYIIYVHINNICHFCNFLSLLLLPYIQFVMDTIHIVLILDCVGYFHRPKKPLIQSRYTHISECFLLARLRRRINTVFCQQLLKFSFNGHVNRTNDSNETWYYHCPSVEKWGRLKQ